MKRSFLVGRLQLGMVLIIGAGLLSSCKMQERLQGAMQGFKTGGSVSSASVAEVQSLREALSQAEQAVQAARAAQQQAEQAAAAALVAQQQAEQYLASLQTMAVPQKAVVDKRGRKQVAKAAARGSPAQMAKRQPAKAAAVAPAPARVPTAVAPTVSSPVGATSVVVGSSFMSASAEASLEAEEEEALEMADTYTARRQAARRAPASVGGATRAIAPDLAARRAENEARFKKALALFESRDEQENVKLTIIEPDGTRKLREVFVQRIGLQNEQRMMARVVSPADLKGAAVLVVATKQRDNQWVYLPSSKQTRKVVVAEQKGVILGSELRYEDFNPAAIRRSSVDLVKQERIEGKTYDIFEAIIPPGTVPYEKAWVWIDPKSEMPIQIEYFTSGEKVKRIEFSDYYKVGDIWRPAKIGIKNLKTKRGTDIEISNVKVNSGFPIDRLSVEALSKVW